MEDVDSTLFLSRSLGLVAAFRRTECGDLREEERDLVPLCILLICGGELIELCEFDESPKLVALPRLALSS